jgi:hypothetical protein
MDEQKVQAVQNLSFFIWSIFECEATSRVTRDRCYDFLNIFAEKF